MKRLLRWIGVGLGGLVALAIIAYAIAYVLSERALNRTYAVPKVAAISIPTDPESIAEGRRLATIRSCFKGCHGKDAEGIVMFDEPVIGRVVAPNLRAAVRKYSDAELVNIIRNGVRPDGRSIVIMPSEVFINLNDEDVGRILAFLKSLPEAPGPGPSVALGPLGRIGVAAGKIHVVAELIALTVPPPEATGDEAIRGRYLARTICAECHGTSLRGKSNPDFTSPSLRIVASYSLEAFTELLRTGVAIGGRKVGEMTEWTKDNRLQLTDAEISALYSYLRTLPEPAGK